MSFEQEAKSRKQGMDEFDLEAEKMGRAEFRLSQLRPLRKKNMGKREVILNRRKYQ